MKKIGIGILLLGVLIFTSCVSTSEVAMSSVGIDPKYFTGKTIKVEADGTLFADSELKTALEWASKNNYKYVVKVDENGGFYNLGYTTTYNSLTNSFSTNPDMRYKASMVYYCFNDEDEFDAFLEHGVPVHIAG